MAQHYFKANRDQLFDVPPAGKEIQLIDIGTHSRGSVFLDGRSIQTIKLEQVFDKISQQIEGFYFGRFDVRTPSISSFQEGRDFKIVELNGVTSEATHIYDPGNSLFEAYKTLREQWRIAFKIGDQNRKKGMQVASLWQVVLQIAGIKKKNAHQ